MPDVIEEKINVVSRPLAQFGFAVLTLVMIGVNVYQNNQFTESIQQSNETHQKNAVVIQKLSSAIDHLNHN